MITVPAKPGLPLRRRLGTAFRCGFPDAKRAGSRQRTLDIGVCWPRDRDDAEIVPAQRNGTAMVLHRYRCRGTQITVVSRHLMRDKRGVSRAGEIIAVSLNATS